MLFMEEEPCADMSCAFTQHARDPLLYEYQSTGTQVLGLVRENFPITAIACTIWLAKEKKFRGRFAIFCSLRGVCVKT